MNIGQAAAAATYCGGDIKQGSIRRAEETGMEVKNIHNNPEERGFFGKVLGYIVSGLKSLLRPKKNTKWDYLVPLSLVGLNFLALNYSMMHYEVYNPTKGAYEVVEESLWEIKDFLFAEFSYAVFIILTTIFLTRRKRLLVLPTFLIFLIVEYNVFYKADVRVSIIETVMGIVFFLSILTIPYFLSSLSLLIKFGNNSKKKISKKPTPIRSAIAWGIYGFGFQILPFTSLQFSLPGSNVKSEFIFIKIFDLLDPIMQKLSTPLDMVFFFSFFPFIFALIGYIIEKYKGGKTR